MEVEEEELATQGALMDTDQQQTKEDVDEFEFTKTQNDMDGDEDDVAESVNSDQQPQKSN